MTQKEKEQAYKQRVERETPKYSMGARMVKAFLTGGLICLIGQAILNCATQKLGIDKETAGSWCSMLLVLASVLLTGFGVYHKCVEWGGAGALVPITGFANSVASAAIEYQKEGQVFGIGCKIFTIAGPVILYGIFTSWALGVLYWAGRALGIL
ncbi:MAG: SpoVA/SpoVAEb family sporulation membrane protein [bacterium]|nr:SpoVA/SpoVAEb family sporulation membrane protein [bacterium]MCM1422383.1 SpoVA/SpoVAEb family sporulation membrane protein [bacterium]